MTIILIPTCSCIMVQICFVEDISLVTSSDKGKVLSWIRKLSFSYGSFRTGHRTTSSRTLVCDRCNHPRHPCQPSHSSQPNNLVHSNGHTDVTCCPLFHPCVVNTIIFQLCYCGITSFIFGILEKIPNPLFWQPKHLPTKVTFTD